MLKFDKPKNLVRLKLFLIKTFDRIADPDAKGQITNEFFQVKDFLYKIPNDDETLKFISEGFNELKKD